MDADLQEAFRRWSIATPAEQAEYRRRWPGVFGVHPGGGAGQGIRVDVLFSSILNGSTYVGSSAHTHIFNLGDLFPTADDRGRAEKIAAIQRLADDPRTPEGERAAARAALKRMGA